MKEGLSKKIMRIACLLTAFFSLTAFSGCDAVFSYLDALLSSSESAGDSSYLDSDTEETSSSANAGDSSLGGENSEEDGGDTSSVQGDSSNEMGDETALNFAVAPITEKYGYQYFATLDNGVNLQKFYKDLYNLCVTFSTSTKNVPSKTVNYSGGETATVYEIGVVNFQQYNLTQEEVITVWSVSMVEFPEFYWMAHSASYTSKSLNLYIDGEYATYAERQRVERALKERANECWTYISKSATDTEKALNIADYVMGNMQYAYKSDGTTPQDTCWAHNVEGIALGQGVCESYAKTYQYFCALMGLDCLTVTGVAGVNGTMGGHAWNTVKIDNVWYDVDLTWEDAYENPYREWIGVPSAQFDETHVKNAPSNGYGNAWLYDLPTRSTTKLQPVSVSENGEIEKYYPNLDTALASLQNSQSNYLINVCPSTRASVGEGITIDPYEVSFNATSFPKTQKITLSGKYISSSNQSVIIANNKISVTRDTPVVIQYGKIKYPIGSSGATNIERGTNGSRSYF